MLSLYILWGYFGISSSRYFNLYTSIYLSKIIAVICTLFSFQYIASIFPLSPCVCFIRQILEDLSKCMLLKILEKAVKLPLKKKDYIDSQSHQLYVSPYLPAFSPLLDIHSLSLIMFLSICVCLQPTNLESGKSLPLQSAFVQ